MKISVELNEAEIKEAIAAFVIRHYNRDENDKLKVSLHYYDAGNDPREHSYFTATVSE